MPKADARKRSAEWRVSMALPAAFPSRPPPGGRHRALQWDGTHLEGTHSELVGIIWQQRGKTPARIVSQVETPRTDFLALMSLLRFPLLVPLLPLLGCVEASHMRTIATRTRARAAPRMSLSAADSYLSSLSSKPAGSFGASHGGVPTPVGESEEPVQFSHAPLSFFAVELLTPKGPRKNPDVGQPHDATRPLVKAESFSSGSWWCAEGGWPSPALRATTEVFYVFSGHGCVTDLDGTRHRFGPGDTVILPKGWSGRWDVMQAIHKVWFVYDHPNVEEKSTPIRAVVTHYCDFAQHHLQPHGVRSDALHGKPATASCSIYDKGPTEVGAWTCTPGSFAVGKRASSEGFHVLEGVFFLTNADGTARRCVAGDTVVLPRGWSGHWDVIETVKKLWVVVE